MTAWQPPTVQEMKAWDDATADIRNDIRTKAIAKGRKAAEKDGKQFSMAAQEKALQGTKSEIMAVLWKLETVNGVTNPTWGDPVWRDDVEQALSPEKERLIKWLETQTDDKFYGSLNEQYGNKGTLSDRQWDSARKGKAQAEKAAAGPSDEEKVIIAWARENLWSDFVASLVRQYDSKGTLSPRQWESLRGMKAKMDAKATAKVEQASDIDLSSLPSGYYSVPDGDTRLKVRVARPTKQSRWHGFIFVSDGGAYGARTNYGRQDEAGGGMYTGKIQDQLKAILADPTEAVTAYGKLTGSCGACGRVLEDEDSLSRGIGPICAAKFEM